MSNTLMNHPFRTIFSSKDRNPFLLYKNMNKMRKGLHIGTSGWSYEKDWKGVFYKSGTSMLQQYLSYFDTAEINSTFYALPKPKFITHLASLDEDFFFTAKIPKKVTHDSRLDLNGEGGAILSEFFRLIEPLGKRIPVLLIQLPPWDISTMADLETFLLALDPSFRYAIEFRDFSWLTNKIWSLLEDYGIANVIVDEPKLPIDLRITADFSYIRWHGHGENPWFNYRYSIEELEDWIPRLEQVTNSVPTTFGYFNNHFAGNAPLNALQMLSLLGTLTRRQERKLESMLEADTFQQTSLDDF
ncbi:DUF72 domain-containing protein [Candidatus Thorarchaeota archaeon]|nr:MAG: DUF72 domain-containing protein [Candidatus Thorarchaeota archaeon]